MFLDKYYSPPTLRNDRDLPTSLTGTLVLNGARVTQSLVFCVLFLSTIVCYSFL